MGQGETYVRESAREREREREREQARAHTRLFFFTALASRRRVESALLFVIVHHSRPPARAFFSPAWRHTRAPGTLPTQPLPLL